ncbi:MAG TPA: TonB-dependent receptor [Methylococcaceae bacterium]|nr:TonB-dependent receptor [Methylococcaceae bacterium]
MNIKKAFIPLLLVPVSGVMADHTPTHQLDEMVITTAHKSFPNTTKATPSIKITREDLAKQNAVSADDVLRGAPGVHTRRRFIGDTNAILSIRGSNMYQSGQNNVYVDGIPIHNHVQSRWDGAPKFNTIAPNSVDSTTVFYGPYSAEFMGGLGGTVEMRTALPDDFEMSMEAMGFIHESNLYGIEEILTGHKEYISAGNRFGDFSILGFYNHIENEGPWQQLDEIDYSSGTSGDSVTGAQFNQDETGTSVVLGGDNGIQNVISDLYEIKVGYDLTHDLRALFTLAFEDGEKESQSRTWLKDSSGNPYWGDGTTKANLNGNEWTPNKKSWGKYKLGGSATETKTLMYGFNLSGKLTEDWDIDTTASFYDNFKNQQVINNFSRNDPAYKTDKSGIIQDREVWWADYSLKLATQNFLGNDDIGFMAGYQFNHSFLDKDEWTSDNVELLEKTSKSDKNSNGGSTQTNSAFMQSDWEFAMGWNLLVGVRYDHWESLRGNSKDSEAVEDINKGRVSPKASLSFTPAEDWRLRYSFSKAHRFPTAEELFMTADTASGSVAASSNLSPESGLFHDFYVQHELDNGYARVSFFYNEMTNEIMYGTERQANNRTTNTMRNWDKTATIGADFIYDQDYLFDLPVGFNLNGTWLNKEVTANANDPTLVGKEWIRTPRWRANATMTYHATPEWDNSVMVQYRSKPYKDNNNSDTRSNRVYGAMTEYTVVNLNSNYRLAVGDDKTLKFSVGINNLLDEEYYDHQAYPSRTYFARIGLDI